MCYAFHYSTVFMSDTKFGYIVPKHSRHRKFFNVKVHNEKRLDGKTRYKITLPKIIGDTNILVAGKFRYNPELKVISFEVEEPEHFPDFRLIAEK